MVITLEERRLKPVYDALDAGQNKTAHTEIVKYLKKSPKSTLGQALRCLTLQRLNKPQEALECYEMILGMQSVDPLGALPAEEQNQYVDQEVKQIADEDKGGEEVKKEEEDAKEEDQKPIVAVKQPSKKLNKKGKGKSKPKAQQPSSAISSATTTNLIPGSTDEILSPSVLQILSFALRSLGRREDIYKLYTRAWAVHADDTDLGVQVFLEGVRRREWESVKRTALRLLAQSQDWKTAAWASFALYIQAIELPKAASEHKQALLSLSSSILQKFPCSPLTTIDTFLLYMRIVRAQGKTMEALTMMTPDDKKGAEEVWKVGDGWEEALVEGTKDGFVQTCKRKVRRWSGELRMMWERWELVEELAEKGGEWDWEKEWERAEDLIRGAEDVPVTNYKAYLSYITALFVLLAKKSTEKRDYLTDSRQTLLDLADQFGRKERAPILALLEINRRAQVPEEQDTDQANGLASTIETATLLERYWKTFGDKGCVMDDLRPYWPKDGEKGSGPLKTFLQEQVESDTTTLDSYLSAMNAHKMLRFISSEGSVAEESAAAWKYLKLYREGLKLVTDLPKTDVHPADDFAIMAAQAFVTCWALEQGSITSAQWLVLAVSALHLLISNSPVDGPARILLIRLYRLLGCPSLIPAQVERLQMRTFQQDTVLHIVTERASSLQIAGGVKAQSIMRTLLSENQAIYRSTENELTEGIVTAMTECSFSQIPGMLEMSDSFSASHQRVVGDLELMRDIAMVDVKAMHQAYSLAPQDLDLSETAELEGIKDLRDWDLLPDYGSHSRVCDLKTRTCMGPLSQVTWLDKMRLMWMLVNRISKDASQEKTSDIARLATANCSEFFTAPELNLLAYAQELCSWIHECSTGSVKEPMRSFVPLPKEEGQLPWIQVQSAATQLEAFAMLELATSQFRDKSSEAHKKCAGTIRELIANSLTAARKTLAASAMGTKKMAAEETWCVLDAELKKTAQAGGHLDEQLQQTLEALTESRRLAFEELSKELTKRSKA